jgi:hypothetical protein
MDKEWLVGWIGAVTIVLIIAAALTVSYLGDLAAQNQYEQICEQHHHTVQYKEVDGSPVSECK